MVAMEMLVIAMKGARTIATKDTDLIAMIMRTG